MAHFGSWCKDFPADTCSVCYKLMEEFGGNNFDDNNH